jgi:phosphatidylethanolamine-binding protein
VIDDFEARCLVTPLYGKKERAVALGNILEESKTKWKPSVKIHCPHPKWTPGITIIITDPDARSREDPKWSEMCHWIAIVPSLSPESFGINVGSNTGLKELVECKHCFSMFLLIW